MKNDIIEISNSKLKELDKQVGNFYMLSARYFTSLSNIYGRKIYKSAFSNILKEADKIVPESKFDTLVLRNIKSNLRLNDLIIDYFSDPKFPLSVKDFFDKIAGKGAWNYLEESVVSPPWELKWKHAETTQERNYSRVDPFTEEAQKAAREWVPKIKEDILKYGVSEGYLPKGFDMHILLLPPKDTMEWSYWNPTTKVFSLASGSFDFFHKDRKVIAIPARAYRVAFHEILGHAAHQIYSQGLPLSLKFTEEIGCVTPTKSVTEGVAIDIGSRAYSFLAERLADLRLNKSDIDIVENEVALENWSSRVYMYFALTKDRELREKGFDGYEHILKLTQNPVLARGFKYDFKEGFWDMWRQIGHTLGPRHYGQMLNYINQEFGESYLIKEKKKFNRATLRGVWSWEIYPDAVAYFLAEENND